MTDTAAALADTSNLPDYQGRTVARTTISIRNAGDGLSEGLAIDPQVLPLGSVVHVVLECTVVGHDHDVMKQAPELLVLDQVLKAGTGTLIDADVVRQAIAQQAEKIQLAKEAAAGTARLPYPDELDKAHDAGMHTDLVPGCPQCDQEQELAAGEAAEADAEQPPAEPTPIAGRRKGGT